MKEENDELLSKLEREAKRFAENTLQFLTDNFITIITILFLVAVITGIKSGCNAPYSNNP